MSLSEHIVEQARKVDRRPTEPQKEAGNYKKGHVRIHGLDISIENPAGSYREGTGADGKRWRARLPAHYGYFKRTEGADGDHVDVFIGPHHKSPHVFVIDQHDHKTGRYDEHKVMLGFASEKQARATYARAFSDGKGHARIGHIEPMSVDQFKAWLKDGDTTKAVKHRAEGGRIGMADGGIPSWDQTTASDSGGIPSWDQTQPSGQDPGILSALGHGAASGATFGFSDELAGLRAAAPTVAGYNIPDLVGPLPARMMAGAARLAKQYITGESDAATAYAQGRDEERAAQRAAKAHQPIAYGAGEIAGSIPAMAAMPELAPIKGAGLAAEMGRGAITGAEYGALSGFGEGDTMSQRVENAGAGVIGGGAAGAGAPVVGKGLEWAGQRFLGPAVQTVQGWLNPEGEAGRRLATALQRDNEMIAAGTAKGMTPQEWVAARNAGEPVTLADLGAGNTQALLRSAANTSPEARAMLENVIENRFFGQSERVADTVRGLVAGGANAGKTAEDLVKAYDAGRKPLYQKSYDEGDKQIMSPAIERLIGSPSFVKAMRGAVSSGQDRAVTEGYGAFNPGVTIDPGGSIRFNRGPTGVPMFPNLQYWDSVKRELDDMAGAAMRSGEKGQGGVLSNMANTLRSELDQQVPSYATARGFASQYFGASNALEAGRQLAGKKVPADVIQKAMAKMKPDERDLFREGYASDWADRVIGNMKDTQDVTKAMFNSPNERARAEAVFGPVGMGKIQARMTLETIMDGARRAMGNSTTARQLIEAGLAGGALGGLEGLHSGWDPLQTVGAFGAGAASPQAAKRLLGVEMAAGAQRLIGRVDSRTARRVAELLTSNDPTQLRQGMQLAASNQRIMNGLRRVANALSMSTLAPSGREAGIRLAPTLQGAVGARADDNQPQSNRLYVGPNRGTP